MIKKVQSRTMRIRILAIILPLTIISMLALSFLSYQTSKSIINYEINNNMNITLNSTILSIQKILDAHSKIPESLARYAEVSGLQMTKDQYISVLKNQIRMNENSFGVGVWFEPNKYRPDIKYFGPYCYRSKGKIVYTDSYATADYDYLHWDWYRIGKNTTQKVAWSSPFFDDISETAMVTAAAPFYDRDGSLLGVASGDIDLTNLQKLVSQLKVGKTGKAFLIDKDGTYIADADPTKIIKVKIQDDPNKSLADLGKVMVGGARASGTFIDENGKNIVYYAQIEETGWQLVISIPEKELNEPLNDLLFKQVVIILIALILISLIMILSSMYISVKQTEQHLYEQNNVLKSQVNIDGLTGLFNHRFLYERLREETEKCIRDHSRLTAMILDIDHFKNINDTYGHLTGDEVLKELSNILRANTRQTDIIGRYGGEEFLIMLPGASSSDGFEVAEKIRRAIERTEFQQKISITASIGVDEYNHESINEFLGKVDAKLYAAKKSGRNISIK